MSRNAPATARKMNTLCVLAIGLTLAFAAVALAPTAEALCTTNSVANGTVYYQLGGCEETWLVVAGHDVLP